MKILIITNLYKNRKEPGKAQFHTQQFKALSEMCDIEIVSPIPYFQFSKNEVPLKDEVDGIKVFYPRYLVIPKIMRSLYWLFFYVGVINCVRKIQEEFDFDVILSMWAYPDGVGSYFIGKNLKKLVVIGSLGSDINVYRKSFKRRNLIACAMKRCAKVIVVSSDLKNKIMAMGVDEQKITVLHNGIQEDVFKPMDKAQCRNELGLPLDKRIVLHVGNHVYVKGVDILIDAAKDLSDEYCVAMVGDGVLTETLKKIVKDGSYKAEVLFAGRKSHDEIPKWINAADVFCLSSRNEGQPNVVLEALACGVPVVASRVGGIPEIINSEYLGVLVGSENPNALFQGIIAAFEKQWDQDVICRRVEGYTWKDNAEELSKILKEAISLRLRA